MEIRDTNNIKWKNIYYMIGYCVDELQYFNDSLIDVEDIKSTQDLLAKLLVKSFKVVYNNGYIRKYSQKSIITNKPHGKLNIVKSITSGEKQKGKLICEIDSLDINNKLNRIIKSAFNLLIETNNRISDKMDNKTLTELYYNRDLLNGVDAIEVREDMLPNKLDVPLWYRPIYEVCRIIIKCWIAKDIDGEHSLLELDDDTRMKYIWEKFVRNFYASELKQTKVSRLKIKANGRTRITDMILEGENSIIVIDTKYYESRLMTISNEDQVYVYANEIKKLNPDKNVIGILLYAGDKQSECCKDIDLDNFRQATWILSINDSIDNVKENLLSLVSSTANDIK